MNGLLQDLRFALRILRRNTATSVIVVVTLAFGIGANASVFTIVNAYLLRPLPFEDPDALVHVWRTKKGAEYGDSLRLAEGDFLDVRSGATAFSELGAYWYGSRTITDADEPYSINVTSITWNLPRLLGVRPTMGRLFRPADAGTRVTLVSDVLWRRQLAADPAIIGRTIELDGLDYEVIGVLPPTFVFPFGSTRLWVPLSMFGRETNRGAGELLVVGRLAPGATLAHAQQQLDVITKRLATAHPKENADLGCRVVPLREALVYFIDQLRGASAALMAATGFLLLIVCTNVGNLLLARAAARKREIAVRASIGASRGRLVRQLVVEGAVLAALGGGVALLMAGAAGEVIGALLPPEMYRVGELSIDARILWFVAVVSAGSVVLFALAPALEGSRIDLIESLKEGNPAAGGGRTGWLRGTLIVSQVALATVLISGTLLSLQAFHGLRQFNPGFAVDNVLTLEINLPTVRYPSGDQQNAFYDQLLTRVRAGAGVAAAAAAWPLPMNWEMHFQEFTVDAGDTTVGTKPNAARYHVAPGYFETMQIPVVEGRDFTPQDRADGPLKVLVSRRLAEQYWPKQSPVGRRLRLHRSNEPEELAEVIGVVGDSKDFMMHEDYRPQIFMSQVQRPTSRRFLTVRTVQHSPGVISAVRSQVREMDRTLAVAEVRQMNDVVFQSVAPVAGVATVLGGLGLGAVLLVAVGIYGVVSFTMRQRTHEIGVRMALGASAAHIVRLVLRQGVRLVALGLIVGVVVVAAPAMAAQRLLGVTVIHPLLLGATAILLAGAGVTASYLPARHAARIQPSSALRQE